MVKLVYFILLSFAFFGLGNCTYYVWNSTVTNGYWNQGSSWLNGTVPGSGDCVFLPASANVIINSAVSIGNVSMNAVSFYITQGGSLTVNNDINFAAAGASLLRIDNGASMTINGRFQLSTGSLTFEIFGTATANGLRISTAGTITQKGPSPVMITGAAQNIFDNSYTIDQSIFYFSAANQQFAYILTGAAPTITFGTNALPIISTFTMINSYQNPFPINLVFNGATFTTSTPIITSNSSSTSKPTVTFLSGIYTLSGTATAAIDGIVTFQATASNNNNIVINGGTITVNNNNDVTFTGSSTLNVMGTGSLSFTSNNPAGTQSAVFSGTVNLFTPISFIQTQNPSGLGGFYQWTGGAATLNIYSAFTVQALITLGPTTTFYAPLTLGPPVNSNPVGIRGSPTLTNALINNAGNQVFYNSITLNCTQGTFQFTSTGTTSLQFPAGFTIMGCAVSAAAGTNIGVVNPIVVNGNSSIDVSTVPLNTTANYPNYNFVGAGSPPANTLFSLTIINSPTFQINNTITATGLDVIFSAPINFPNFPYGLTFAGSGQFDFPSSVSVGDKWTISAPVGFPSGAVTINLQSGASGTLPVQWSGSVILRATTLTGNAPIIYLAGSIFITNGVSAISSPTFQFYNPLTITYQFQSSPGYENPSLVFNSGQARVWFNAFTAGNKVAAIFDENLIFNTSVTFTATAPGGTIVFRGATSITSVGPQTSNFNFNGYLNFNGTSFRITGPGSFNFNNNIELQGNLNFPFSNTDATIFLGSGITVYATANSFFGPTVIIQGPLTTDDGDGNANTANTGLTVQGFAGIPQVLVGGTFSLGTNLTFTNSLLIKSGTTFSGTTGFVILQGTCVTTQAAVNFNTRAVMPSPINFNLTSSQYNGLTITFSPNTGSNARDGLWFQGNVGVQTGLTLTLSSSSATNLFNVYFLSAATLNGAGTLILTNADLFATNGAVSIAPKTVISTNSLFTGPGAFSISPTDNILQVNGLQNATTPVTYTGSTILLNSNTQFTPLFGFTGALTNITATTLTNFAFTNNVTFSNTITLVNIGTITFQKSATFTTATTPFTTTGATSILFNSDVTFTTATVTFGTGLTVTVPGTSGIFFQAGSATTLNGNSTWVVSNVNFNAQTSNLVTIAVTSLTLTSDQFSGPGTFSLNPGNGLLFVNGLLNATTSVVYVGPNVQLNGATRLTSNFTFSSAVTTFNTSAGAALTLLGNYTISNTFALVNVVNVIFTNAAILNSATPFTTQNTATITFNSDITVGTTVLISNGVTFAISPSSPPANINFLAGSSLSGNTSLSLNNANLFAAAGAISISTTSLTLNAVSYFGPGTFTVTSLNTLLNVAGLQNATTSVSFAGTNVQIVGGSVTFTPLFTFTASVVNFNTSAGGVINFSGNTTITNTFALLNIGSVTFLNAAIFNSGTPFTTLTSTTVTFNSDITFNTNVAITFGMTFTATGRNLNFAALSTGVSGNGTLLVTSSNLVAAAAVVLAPGTLVLTNDVYFGPGSFMLSPSNTLLQLGSLQNATTSVQATTTNVQINSATTITPLFTFTSPTTTFNASAANRVTFVGTYTVSNTLAFTYNPPVIFQNTAVFASTSPFTTTSSLTVQFSANATFNAVVNIGTGVTYNVPSNNPNSFLLFNAASGVNGNGTLTVTSATLTAAAGAIVINPSTLILTGVSYFGPGTFSVASANGLTQIGGLQNATTTVTSTASNIQLNGSPVQFTPGFTFSVATTLNASSPTTAIFTGTTTISQGLTLINVNQITFSGPAVINAATPFTSLTGTTVTFNSNVTINSATLNIPSGVTLNIPSTTPASNVFLSSTTVTGNGTLSFSGLTLTSQSAGVTFTVGSLSLANILYSGPGTFTLSPTTNVMLGGLQNATTPVSSTGPIVLLVSTTNITSQFTFAVPTNFTNQGGNALYFLSSQTLPSSPTFIFTNVANVYFTTTVFINAATPFSNQGPNTVNFFFDVILGTSTVTVPQNVTFGLVQAFSSLTVSGGILTLTGQSITVNGNINVLPGAAVLLNLPGSGLQQLTGNNAQIPAGNAQTPSGWAFNNPICFIGNFNFTGAVSVPLNHFLNGKAVFTQGVTFNGGSFNGTNANVFAQYYLTSTSTVLQIASLTSYGSTPFSFNGTGSLTVNGSYVCNEAVTFTIPAIFGNNNGAGSSITLNSGCVWNGSPVITLNVGSVSGTNNPISIYTPLNFACSSSVNTLNFAAATGIYLYGNIAFNTPQTINFAGTNFGAITVTSNANTTATGINPVALVTFTNGNSAIEPIISFNGALTQPILLTSPTRLESITLGPLSSVTSTGSGRADFSNALTLISTVVITTPYNFFVTTNNSQFQLTCTPATPSVFSFAPPVYNPYGFPLPPNYLFTVGTGSTIKFAANPTYSFNNAQIVGSGTVRFTGGTSINVQGTLLVNPGSILWADLVPITAFNLTLAPPPTSNSVPSYFKYSVASNNNNPTVTATYAIYGGGAVVFLSNYIPTSSVTLPMIQATSASGNTLSPVGGSPGYTYSLSRNGQGLSLTINPNTKPTQAPTQSNGPSPPVNGATKIQVFSFALLFISIIFSLMMF